MRQPLKIDGGTFNPYTDDLSIDHGHGVCVCGKKVGEDVKWTDSNIDRTERKIAIHRVLSGCQMPRIINKVNILVGTVYRKKTAYRYFVRRGDHDYQALVDNGKDANVLGEYDNIWEALSVALRTLERAATQTGVKGFEVNLNPDSVVNGEGLVGAAPPDFNTALERYSETINRTQSTKEMVRVRLEAERYRAAFESIISLVDTKLLGQIPR